MTHGHILGLAVPEWFPADQHCSPWLQTCKAKGGPFICPQTTSEAGRRCSKWEYETKREGRLHQDESQDWWQWRRHFLSQFPQPGFYENTVSAHALYSIPCQPSQDLSGWWQQSPLRRELCQWVPCWLEDNQDPDEIAKVTWWGTKPGQWGGLSPWPESRACSQCSPHQTHQPQCQRGWFGSAWSGTWCNKSREHPSDHGLHRAHTEEQQQNGQAKEESTRMLSWRKGWRVVKGLVRVLLFWPGLREKPNPRNVKV